MENINVPELVQRLSSEEESVRKMAVFKLQGAIGDPSFADIFINEGGLPKLRYLAVHSTGNTLAYCLTSLSRLLELDKGWDQEGKGNRTLGRADSQINVVRSSISSLRNPLLT
jgi:engulfment/cell motility protein 1